MKGKPVQTPAAVKLDADVHSYVKALADARGNRSIRRARGEARSLPPGRYPWLGCLSRNWVHVSHAEADAWLAQLAAGDDQEPPECNV
jgi:hypothetical protein